MTRLEFSLQVSVKHVGILALIGRKRDIHSADERTIVYFACQCPHDAPLAQYFQSWAVDRSDIFNSITDEMESVDGNYQLKFFTRTVKGKLENPRQLLCSTANILLRELQRAEDCELSLRESRAELDWAGEHMDCNCATPDFSLPRHT